MLLEHEAQHVLGMRWICVRHALGMRWTCVRHALACVRRMVGMLWSHGHTSVLMHEGCVTHVRNALDIDWACATQVVGMC